MPRFTIEDMGDHEEVELSVTIKEPRFELAEKDGDQTRMTLVLPGYAADGKHIDAYLYFTRQIITSGRDKGKPAFEVSAERCHQIGMSRPFSPSKLPEIDGAEVVFVVKRDEYQGKVKPKVAFINTPRKAALSAEEAGGIWAALTGQQAEKPKTQEPAAASASDGLGLPF